MAYFAGDPEADATNAQLYAAGLIAVSVLTVVYGHPYMLGLLHLGMKMRVALCSLIYRKALRLNRTSLGDTTVGQVVNLLSNDVGRFDTVLINVHYLWIAPVELIVVTYLMYREVSGLFREKISMLVKGISFFLDWNCFTLWSCGDAALSTSSSVFGKEDIGAASTHCTPYG